MCTAMYQSRFTIRVMFWYMIHVWFFLTIVLFWIFFPVEEGKLATGEIPLHDGNHLKWIHRIFMGGYLLITNVLLINLLIAIFRYRVERFKYNISVRKIIIWPLQLTDRLTTDRQRHTDRLTRRHTHRHAHTRTRRHTDWLTDDGEAGMAQ